MRVREIGPISIFFGQAPFYPYCNTILIRDERTLLVDPACGENALRAVRAGGRVDLLFNTHYHPDHIRYNGLFHPSDFWVHRDDAPCFRSLDSMAEWVGVRGTEYEKDWRASMIESFEFRPEPSIREVVDGMELSLGKVSLRFIHLPGHTPGHTGFLIPELSVMLLADVELSPAGPWYHNKRSDIQQIVDSVEKVRKISADYYIPSHGEEVFTGDIGPRLDRYLENIHLREDRILRALEAPLSLAELADLGLISGLKIPRGQVWYFFERTMVEKHLERLLRWGKISRLGDRYRRED